MFLIPLTTPARGLWRDVDRLFGASFDRLLSAAPASTTPLRGPALDVAESDQAYTVTLDLPGVAKDEVKVSIDGRRVAIEAAAGKSDERKEGDRIVYRERSTPTYARTLVLPVDIDQERSRAKLDKGVLKLELAKRDAPSAKRIAVN
jgi:HSP20 family protein